MRREVQAYFEDDEIMENVQHLDYLAELYYKAGMTEEEAEEAAWFDWECAEAIKRAYGPDGAFATSDAVH